MRTAHAAGPKGKYIVGRGKNRASGCKDSVIYKTPCRGCPAVYYGKLSCGIGKRISEHKSGLRHHRIFNCLVVHAEKHGHLLDWNSVKVLHTGPGRRMRTVEAACIATG